MTLLGGGEDDETRVGSTEAGQKKKKKEKNMNKNIFFIFIPKLIRDIFLIEKMTNED